MSKRIISVIFVLAVLSGAVFAAQRVFAEDNTPGQALPPQNSASSGPQGSLSSPGALVSFTVSNPYCYQPNPSVDACSINVRSIQAVGDQVSAPYMTWLAISISGKSLLNTTAFFEDTITYAYNMVPDGLIVPCGAPNAGGAGDKYGYVYGLTIQPLDSNRNPMATDIANITCPAYTP